MFIIKKYSRFSILIETVLEYKGLKAHNYYVRDLFWHFKFSLVYETQFFSRFL